MTVVVLYGPKAVGKSHVAELLHSAYGVAHVDADEVVLDRMAEGAEPDHRHGWLPDVEAALTGALASHQDVSVEATGAWDTDWQLADDLAAAGHRVVRIWVSAPLDVTLRRLAARTTRKVPAAEAEARSIWAAAHDRARGRPWDLVLDTGRLRKDQLPAAVAPVATLLRGT